jgi:hypothetical protein
MCTKVCLKGIKIKHLCEGVGLLVRKLMCVCEGVDGNTGNEARGGKHIFNHFSVFTQLAEQTFLIIQVMNQSCLREGAKKKKGGGAK